MSHGPTQTPVPELPVGNTVRGGPNTATHAEAMVGIGIMLTVAEAEEKFQKSFGTEVGRKAQEARCARLRESMKVLGGIAEVRGQKSEVGGEEKTG